MTALWQLPQGSNGAAPVKTTVENIRAFEDGDKVFLHTVYNFAGMGEQVAFDIFRFDEDKRKYAAFFNSVRSEIINR